MDLDSVSKNSLKIPPPSTPSSVLPNSSTKATLKGNLSLSELICPRASKLSSTKSHRSYLYEFF